MKYIKFKQIALFLAMVLSAYACQESEEPIAISPESPKISEYLETLDYDPDALLNVQETDGAPSKREILEETVDVSKGSGVELTCATKVYNLKNNFEDVAILRPTNGIVWPGALVYGDASLLKGIPTPVALKRSEVTLRLDLPGIGDNGIIKVENPVNSNVQSSIDNALDWWNNNAYQDGYVNASNSSQQVSTSYSSKQLSLDVGLNVEWAQGDVSAQFNYTSSSEEKVAMMVFKQVFYTISADTPLNPGDVFAGDVSLEKIKEKFNSSRPPAYVHSVSFGRIIMFRMQTTASATDTQIAGAFNYASGFVSASGETETKYKEILEKSSITTITIGGNAEVASEAATAKNFGDLNAIITGENAVYSKNNPGVPIAYTVRYLKDNTFAKMGFTTDYEVQECNTVPLPAAKINVKNNTGPGAEIGWDMRFVITYKNLNGETKSIGSGLIIKGNAIDKEVPAGSHDINLRVEYVDGLEWKKLGEGSWNAPTNACYEGYGSWYLLGKKTPDFRVCK
jgi:thiol-activated cytolysin